jgi:ATP-dependent DNA ligase
MKQLPTLFSRTSTGAIQQWSIETDGNKFRVTSGQVDGKLVVNEWTVCEGKNLGKTNETSPSKQAESEAKSKWDKKSRMGYTADVKKIDSCMVYVEPMTAKKLVDRVKKIDFKKGVLVQNKFNGHRCTARLESGKVVLRTRTGKLYYSVVHINKDLEKFFKVFPDAVVDGELFNNELRTKLNEISSLLRQQEDVTVEELKKSEELIRFYIYDGYGFNDDLGEDSDYILRKECIDKNLPKYTKYCHVVKTDLAHSMEEVDKIYFAYLKDEQEGAIIRIPNSPYEHSRSANLLKYKPVDSDECIILSVHEGTGNWAGTAKTATVRWKNMEFDATFKGSWELGAERLANPKPWIGTEVTFLYNGLTGKAPFKPNYARIDPENCFEGDK